VAISDIFFKTFYFPTLKKLFLNPSRKFGGINSKNVNSNFKKRFRARYLMTHGVAQPARPRFTYKNSVLFSPAPNILGAAR